MQDKISALIRTAKCFSDKGQQVTPASFGAFGIALTRRYGKAYELIEMLQFAQSAASASVAHYVKSVEYDSKASICSFVLDESVVDGSEVERQLLAIAKSTIAHFYWFDDEHFDTGDED